MARTYQPDADDAALTPTESLALIESTLRDTRGALGFSDWPLYLAWGIAWAVGFTISHLAHSGDAAAPARPPEAVVGPVWLVCVACATLATGLVIRRSARGLTGTTARVGRRLGLSWFAACVAAGALGGLLGLDDHEFAALFVFVVALLYVGQGAAFGDDLQLGVGVWLMAVDVLGLAVGPDWFNVVLAVFGAGALMVAAVLSRRGRPSTALDDG